MNFLKFSSPFAKSSITSKTLFKASHSKTFYSKKILSCLFFKKFSTSAFNQNDSNQFLGSLITRADTNVARSNWDGMSDMEDRFHLSKIYDVKKLFLILKQNNYNFPLNDLVHFLRRIVELNEEKQLKINIKNSIELGSFFQEIKKNLRQGTQEYPLIGSYAWCFWKLKHYDDSELWLTLGDYIIDERFSPNFNESISGIEGFTVLEGIAEQPFIDEVYKKLERILVLTIAQVNITHYKRITDSLLKVHRFTKFVFDSLERHLIHFLSTQPLEYDLKLMLDILAAFALSGNGSERLFYSFEHIFNTFYQLPPENQQELINGEFIAKLVQTYALGKMIQPSLVYDKTFRHLIHNLIINDAQYTLEELVNIIQHVNVFEFENIDEINKLLDQRIFEVTGKMKGDDMIRYIDIKVGRDCEGEYSKLPKGIMKFFDNYLNVHMEEQLHHQIYCYISEMEDRKLMSGKEEVLKHLVAYVSQRLHIYDFEELCYFYWLFNKYYPMIDMENPKVQCELSQIKDHIRLYSAFSKGRLRIGSNFYKMLEVVSGSDFLTQGEYPDW